MPIISNSSQDINQSEINFYYYNNDKRKGIVTIENPYLGSDTPFVMKLIFFFPKTTNNSSLGIADAHAIEHMLCRAIKQEYLGIELKSGYTDISKTIVLELEANIFELKNILPKLIATIKSKNFETIYNNELKVLHTETLESKSSVLHNIFNYLHRTKEIKVSHKEFCDTVLEFQKSASCILEIQYNPTTELNISEVAKMLLENSLNLDKPISTKNDTITKYQLTYKPNILGGTHDTKIKTPEIFKLFKGIDNVVNTKSEVVILPQKNDPSTTKVVHIIPYENDNAFIPYFISNLINITASQTFFSNGARDNLYMHTIPYAFYNPSGKMFILRNELAIFPNKEDSFFQLQSESPFVSTLKQESELWNDILKSALQQFKENYNIIAPRLNALITQLTKQPSFFIQLEESSYGMFSDSYENYIQKLLSQTTFEEMKNIFEYLMKANNNVIPHKVFIETADLYNANEIGSVYGLPVIEAVL